MVMSPWLRFALFILTLVLVVCAHIYLYRRLVRDVLQSKLAKWALTGALGGVSGLAVMLRRISLHSEWGVSPSLILAIAIWFGVFLNLLWVTLAIDAFGFLKRRVTQRRKNAPEEVSLERRQFLTRSVAAGSTLLAGSLASYGTWRAFHRPDISEVPIRLRGFPKALEGFTLLQISDIHVGPILQRKFMDELVRQVNAQKPDLVAITGDLVDGSVSFLGPSVAALAQLQSRFGSYFVTGNHEYYVGADAWISALKGFGIPTLRNQRVSIGDSASFDLLGVDDFSARIEGHGYNLQGAADGRNPERASVLLAHQPRNFDEVADLGIGLQLSGHTHGGQMFPGTVVGALVWGSKNTGLTRLKNSHLYTSRGCGFVGPPMRIGAPPEIVKIVLLPA